MLRFEHVNSVRHTTSVNSSHLEGRSICQKYNEASAVLTEVYCSTSQHNSILLVVKIFMSILFGTLKYRLAQCLLCVVSYCFRSIDFFIALEIIPVDVIRLRRSIFSLVLNCTCWSENVFIYIYIWSTLLRLKELILHLFRNAQRIFNDLRNKKPEKRCTVSLKFTLSRCL